MKSTIINRISKDDEGHALFITEDENIITMAKFVADGIYDRYAAAKKQLLGYTKCQTAAFPIDAIMVDEYIIVDSIDQVKSLAEYANEELEMV